MAVLVSVGVGAWQGVAGAGALHQDASAGGRTKIEYGGASCGNEVGSEVIGWVKIQRRKKKTEIDYKLDGALPNTVYTVTLWQNDPLDCVQVALLGTVKTDANGKTKLTKWFYPLSSSIHEVFTDGDDGSRGNDSIAVHV